MTDYVPAVLILLPPAGKGGRASAKSASGSASKRSADENRIPVQFNPTSLRLQRQSSQRRSGMLTKNQQVQYPSTQAATLSFDLEFDSAEDVTEGRTGQGAARPVDVRVRSGRISQLTQPATDEPAGAPNRVRFEWGTFAFQGVVTQLTEEFDYFAPDGTPLRSKISLTIEEQDPKLEAKERGAGARRDEGATLPGGSPARPPLPGPGLQPPPGATPGRGGTANRQQAVAAQEGESVQQLAARLGGDPAAWRSLMTDLSSPTALTAGTSVIVGPELDTSAVIGQATGFATGFAVSPVDVLATALGLPAGPSPADLQGAAVSGAASAFEAVGFVLSAAGGLAAATRTVVAAAAAAAVDAERSAFDLPAASTAFARVALPVAPVEVDRRAISYGRAIPLRSQLHAPTAADARIGGRRSIAARAAPAELTVSEAPSVRPWERLPPAAVGRAASDLAQRGRDVRASTMRWRPGGGCR